MTRAKDIRLQNQPTNSSWQGTCAFIVRPASLRDLGTKPYASLEHQEPGG